MLDFKNIKPKFNKKNSNSFNLLFKYLPCFLKGEVMIIFGIFVLSFAYYKISGYNNILYYSTFLVVASSAFITGRATYKKLGGRGIISGFLGSLPIAIINTLIVYISSYKSTSLFILIILPVSIFSGAIGGILASNSKKRY